MTAAAIALNGACRRAPGVLHAPMVTINGESSGRRIASVSFIATNIGN